MIRMGHRFSRIRAPSTSGNRAQRLEGKPVVRRFEHPDYQLPVPPPCRCGGLRGAVCFVHCGNKDGRAIFSMESMAPHCRSVRGAPGAT